MPFRGSRKSPKAQKSRKSPRARKSHSRALVAAAGALVAAGAAYGAYMYFSPAAPVKPPKSVPVKPGPPAHIPAPLEIDYMTRNEKKDGHLFTGHYLLLFINDERDLEQLKRDLGQLGLEYLDIRGEGYKEFSDAGAKLAIRVSYHGLGDTDGTREITFEDGSVVIIENPTLASEYLKIRSRFPESRARPTMLKNAADFCEKLSPDVVNCGKFIEEFAGFDQVVEDIKDPTAVSPGQRLKRFNQ